LQCAGAHTVWTVAGRSLACIPRKQNSGAKALKYTPSLSVLVSTTSGIRVLFAGQATHTV
jgi:hypothetical protein